MLEVDVRTQDYASKINDWHNDDNAQYYDNLSFTTFQQYAIAAGLDTCCDLELIRPQIMQANSILEVAAGYGRVVDGLRQMGYKKKIVAVERCKKFYSLLRTKSTEAVCADIRDFQSGEKFDVILWLWAGICEFAPEEQCSVLLNLSTYLKPTGQLFLDTKFPETSIYAADRGFVLDGKKNSYIYVYTPSLTQLDHYADNLELNVHHSSYPTSNNRSRMLHRISRITV